MRRCGTDRSCRFQSTPPARGATLPSFLSALPSSISIHAPREGGDQLRHQLVQERRDFNPRPPRGGRLKSAWSNLLTGIFQSTPPARGATSRPCRGLCATWAFQSTPPARGATEITFCSPPTCKISIHAPREGGDRLDQALRQACDKFQSTPPARGATPDCR